MSETQSPITIPKKNPIAPRRLLVSPHAGSSFLSYLPMAEKLSPEFEVGFVLLPNRIPGISNNWPCNWSEWIHLIFEALRTDPRPLWLFGHSFGALNSIELLRALSEKGLPPEKLILSSLNAERDTNRKWSKLPDFELITVLETLGENSGDSGRMVSWKDLPGKMRNQLLQTLRADFHMIETASALESLSEDAKKIPTLVFGGSDDQHVRPENLPRWKGFLNVEEVSVFPGAHFWLFSDLNILCREIKSKTTGMNAST
jgi:surfactin synthase thioesterase subunit